jgi:hypothetical protein
MPVVPGIARGVSFLLQHLAFELIPLPLPEQPGSTMKSHPTARATSVVCALIFCTLLAGCGSNATPGSGGNAKLMQITIAPANKSIPKGTNLRLSATGIFADGSQQDLSSSVTWRATPSTVATIDAEGDLAGLAVGVAHVSAAYQGIAGNTSTTVGPPALLQIALSSNQSSLPLGESEPLTATGSFSDGSTQNLTGSVTWQASPSTVASISAQGDLKALNRGVAQVSAACQGVTGNTSITVGPPALLQIALSPNQSYLPLGESEPMTAMGNLSDGTQQNLTKSVAWTSSGPAIATVSPAGAVIGKALGTTIISASVGSVTGTASLTVTAPVIVALNITPATSSLILGSSGSLQAIATFSDRTTQNMTSTATWSSTQPRIIGVSRGGVATAEQVGSATILAEGSGLTGSASLTVIPLMTVGYFDRVNAANSGYDGTVRLVDPGFTPGDLCAMVYVFDQNQELNECCGCKISDSGLRTLSLINDLTANPLTGKQPVAGTIEILPSNTGQNGLCNAGSFTPNSVIQGWETNVQGSPGAYEVTEIPLATVPLTATQAQVLASECSIMQQLGSGKGICSCGSGD